VAAGNGSGWGGEKGGVGGAVQSVAGWVRVGEERGGRGGDARHAHPSGDRRRAASGVPAQDGPAGRGGQSHAPPRRGGTRRAAEAPGSAVAHLGRAMRGGTAAGVGGPAARGAAAVREMPDQKSSTSRS